MASAAPRPIDPALEAIVDALARAAATRHRQSHRDSAAKDTPQ